MNTEPLLASRSRARITRLFACVALVAMTVMSMPFRPASAAVLSTAKDYLNRQQAGLTTGVTHQIFFTTATAVEGGTGNNDIIILFPDADDGEWCTTAGAVTATGIVTATGAATSESATELPGALTTSTCAAGSGSGTANSNSDRIIVNTVNDLTADTKYGVQIVGGAGTLGTATDAGNNIKIIIKTNNGSADVDSFTVATSLVTTDQYTISASIDPTLTVALSVTTVNLGDLTPANISYQGVTSTVTTNSKNGYVSMVKYSGKLSNGVDDIADSGTTVTKGTSGFGASTSASTQTINTSDASPACSTTKQTSAAGPFVSTTLTTALQQFSSAATPVAAEGTTLCFLAAVSGVQAPGSYSTTVTLVTTAKY